MIVNKNDVLLVLKKNLKAICLPDFKSYFLFG